MILRVLCPLILAATVLAACQNSTPQTEPAPATPSPASIAAVAYVPRADTPTPTVVPPSPTPQPSATPSPSPTVVPPTPTITLTPTPTPIPWRELPLADLAPDATEYLLTREGNIGVAVVVPDTHTIYTDQGHRQFHLASVAKLLIMLTLLNRAVDEARPLTDYESAMVEPMITLSWNDGATELWEEVGGYSAIRAYLVSIEATEILPDPDGAWGASEASAVGLGQLLARLMQGDILNAEQRTYALGLLSQAATEMEDEGVTVGLSPAQHASMQFGRKDGWYGTDEGWWWVNSVGFFQPSDGQPAYTIAILSDDQPSLDDGTAMIEQLASLIHRHMAHLSAK